MDYPTFTEICNTTINWLHYANTFSQIQTDCLWQSICILKRQLLVSFMQNQHSSYSMSISRNIQWFVFLHYLAKPKIWKLHLVTYVLCATFLPNIIHVKIITWSYELSFIHKTINHLHQTRPRQGTNHPTMSYALSSFTMSAKILGTISVVGIFLVSNEIQWTQSMTHFTTVPQHCYQLSKKQDSELAYHAYNTVCCSMNSTSFNYGPPLTTQQKIQLIRFRESHISRNISSESSRLKTSSSD